MKRLRNRDNQQENVDLADPQVKSEKTGKTIQKK